jgi:hypothetical protein
VQEVLHRTQARAIGTFLSSANEEEGEVEAMNHIVLAPGQNIRCRCGERASQHVLCRRCREIVSTCGQHNMTIEEERERHCKDQR